VRCFSASHGAKNANIDGTVVGCDAPDVFSFLMYGLFSNHELSSTARKRRTLLSDRFTDSLPHFPHHLRNCSTSIATRSLSLSNRKLAEEFEP
jgi:hypothetical protein